MLANGFVRITEKRMAFSSLGLYSSKRFSSRWAEVFDVAKAATLGCAIVFVAAIFLRIRMVTPLFILLFWMASTLAGAGSRVVLPLPAGGRTPARPQPAGNGGGRHQSPRPALCPRDRGAARARLPHRRLRGWPVVWPGNVRANGLPACLGPAGLPVLPPRAGG